MKTTDKKNDYLGKLNELAKLEDNNCCLECGATSPRWASVSIGGFLCMVCAGLHRSLGVHLSRVKSLTLDSWTAEQYEYMKTHGNKIAKIYFEANLPKNYTRPKDKNAILAFIKDKYEYRRWTISKIPYDKWTPNNNEIENKQSIDKNEKSLKLQNIKETEQSSSLKDIFSNSPNMASSTTHEQDIFGLNAIKNESKNASNDLFDCFQSVSNNNKNQPTTNLITNDLFGFNSSPKNPTISPSQQNTNLFEVDQFKQPQNLFSQPVKYEQEKQNLDSFNFTPKNNEEYNKQNFVNTNQTNLFNFNPPQQTNQSYNTSKFSEQGFTSCASNNFDNISDLVL